MVKTRINNEHLALAAPVKDNQLPTMLDVIKHYFYVKEKIKETNKQFIKKNPGFGLVKGRVLIDIIKIWGKSGIAIIKETSIESKLKLKLETITLARYLTFLFANAS